MSPSSLRHLLAVPAVAAALALPALGDAKLKRINGVIGQSVTYQVTTDPFKFFALVPSFTTGPIPLAILDPTDPRLLDVGLDLQLFAKLGACNGLGVGSVTYPIPNDGTLAGIVLYAQAFTLPGTTYFAGDITPRSSHKLAVANSVHFTIDDQPNDVDGHANTLLNDGRVLTSGGAITVAGLVVNTDALSIYDPQKQTHAGAGVMSAARTAHTATILNDGRVLMLGGQDANGTVQASTEIFDPATGVSTATAPMSTPRSQHTATLLNDGRVFVAGGVSMLDVTNPIGSVASALGTTQIYNPATNTWSAGPNLPKPRLWHAATKLNDGRVLLTAGVEVTLILGLPVPSVVADCRIYNPATNMFSAAAGIPGERATHAQHLLSNGNVAVIGGAAGNILLLQVNPLSTCRIYNPGTNAWTSVASMNNLRARGDLLTAGGKLYAIGGVDTFDLSTLNGNAVADIEEATESMSAWTVVKTMIYPRTQATPVFVDGGERCYVNGTAQAGSGAPNPDLTAEVWVR
jgi:N-acetylneuraminic acid mutarotase